MFDWFETHKKTTWFLAISIAITIFLVSSLSVSGQKSSTPDIKPVVYHIAIFFFLNLFLQFALVKGKNPKLIFLATILSLLYAISDEIHQSFVPNRSATLRDVLLDTLGITYSILIYAISLEYKKLRKRYKL